MSSRASLPPPSDPRWYRAPRASDGTPTPYLPFGRPFVPDVSPWLDNLRASTRLGLLADGFPARLEDGRLRIHPLDGRYLLDALLRSQASQPWRQLSPFIARTARAIVSQAEPLGDALVLRYRDTASSMVDGRPHISGMAQAYAAAGLTEAAEVLGGDPDLGRAADRFFEALRIPFTEGGALYRTGRDRAIALVPTRPRDLVLNGWLSSLVAIHRYAQRRRSTEARDLLDDNLRTLRRLLPLYDVPGLRLSRYALSGALAMRLTLSHPSDAAISRLRVAIPNEGEITIPVRAGSRWVPRIEPDDVLDPARAGRGLIAPRGEHLRFSAVLSRAGYPRPNRVRLNLRTNLPQLVRVSAHIGDYSPDTSSMVARRWSILWSRRLPAGRHALDIELPYAPIDLFAYPTNFTRGEPGERANTYHATHIVRLRELADIAGEPLFREWAERWIGYVREWPSMPLLAGGVCRTPEGELED